MPGSEQINELIDQRALDQFARLKDIAAMNVVELEKLIAKGVELNRTFGGNISFAKLAEDSKKLAASEAELAKQQKVVLDQQKMVAQADVLAAKAKAAMAEADLRAAKASTEESKARKNNAATLVQEAKAAEIAEKAKLREAAASQKAADAARKSKVEVGPTTVGNDSADLGKTGTTVNQDDLKALEEQLNAQKDLGDALNESTINRKRDNEETKKTTVESGKLTRAKENLAEAESEENIEIQKYNVLAKEANVIAKRQALDALGLSGAYEKLELSLAEARINAKNLGAQFGVNSVQAKAAAKETTLLDNQIKAIDKTVGQSQRNVGNYGGAFNKAFQGLRTLANILPGIGIAGLIGAAVTGITALLEKLNVFSTVSGKVNDAIEESSKAIGKEVGELNAYYKITQDTNIALSERQKATVRVQEIVEKNNKATGEHTTLLVDQNGVLGENQAAINKVTESLIQQAKVQGIVSAIGEAYSKLIRDQNADLSAFDKYVTSIARTLGNPLNIGEALADTKASNIDDDTKALEGLQKALQDLLATGGGGVSNTGADKAFAQFKAEGIKRLQDEAALQKQISQIVVLELGVRTNARENAADKEQFIAYKEYDAALRNASLKLNNSKKTAADEAAYSEAIRAARETAADKARDIEKDLNDDLIDIRGSYYQREMDLDKQYQEMTVKSYAEAEQKQIDVLQASQQKSLQAVSIGRDISLRAENDKFTKRLAAAGTNQKKIEKATKEHADNLTEIELKYAVDVLKIQIDLNEKLISLQKSIGLDTGAAEAELSKQKADLSNKLTELLIFNNQRTTKSDQTRYEKANELAMKIADATRKAFDLTEGILNIGFVNEKNRLQEQSDLIDRNKEKQIEAVNASAASEQEKADKIAVIDARAQAQKDAIAIKQRQVQQREAQFAKARAISEIILNTALAVTAALARDPKGIFAAIAIGALGAAQLAIAIATPIPKYKHGTDFHPGGAAIVGDGGKRELVVTPGGKLMETPASPTVMNMPRGSVVHPDSNELIAAGLISRRGGRVQVADNRMSDMIGKKLDNLTRAVKEKPVVKDRVGARGFERIVQYGISYKKYIDDNIHFK